MVKRQCLQAQDVGRLDGQQFGSERGHMPRQILGRRFGKRELAYLHFGYDLPNAGHAEKQIGRFNDPASLPPQPPVVRNCP